MSQEIMFNESILSKFFVHPNVARVHETIETSGLTFVVMDLLQRDLLEEIETVKHTYKWKLKVADEILASIEYLHQRDLCHRDIKLENVMLDQLGHSQVTDFGFTAFAHEKVTGVQGSIGHVAPEVMSAKPYDGKKADMWSFGCLLYHLFTNKLPPTHGAMDFTGVPKAVARIILKLLNISPEQRPTASDVRKERIFCDIEDRPATASVNFVHDDRICYRVAEILQEDVGLVRKMIETPSKERTMFILVSERMQAGPELCANGQVMTACSYPPPSSSLLQMLTEERQRRFTVEKNHGEVALQLHRALLRKKFCVSTSVTGVKTAIINRQEDDLKMTFQVVDELDGKCTIVVDGDDQHVDALMGEIFVE